MSMDLSVAQMMNQPPRCHKFITGLKILLVDDNPEHLEVLRNRLRVLCKHEVLMCTGARDALSKLGEKKDRFDIVLAECGMREIDGLQLLDSIRSMEIADQLPVLLFSDNLDMVVAECAIEKGACDFFVKPIHDDLLKMIWMHPFRWRLRKEEVHAIGALDADQLERSFDSSQPLPEDSGRSLGMKWSSVSGDNQGIGSNDRKCSKDSSTEASTKKRRVRWTPELQQKFEEAIIRIIKRKDSGGRLLNSNSGELQVLPKEIVDEMRDMGITGLTRQNVSSHLQKHRANRKKQVEEQQSGLPMDFSGPSQYPSLPIRLHPPAPAAPYFAPMHHLSSQNFTIGHQAQQPNNYFLTGQQVGLLPTGRMNQQLTLPLNHINQLNLWNFAPNPDVRSLAPTNMQFRTPSVFAGQNQQVPGYQQIDPSTFSPAINSCQFVSAPMSLNEDIRQQLGLDLDDLALFNS